MKIAVMGLGIAAQVMYLPLLARRRDLFELAAVCDLDDAHAARIGGELGVTAYGDPMVLLDRGGFDALIVLTNGTHAPLVRAALDRGYWVLCEKPLAYSRAELDAIPADARLMVGYMKQYDPASQRMAEVLHEAGGPESVRHLDVTVLHPSSESQLLFAKVRTSHPSPEALAPYAEVDEKAVTTALGPRAPQRLRRLYSQVVLGSLCHDMALMRMFTDPPTGVDHVAVWPDDVFPPSVEANGDLAVGRYSLRWHYLPGYPSYQERVIIHHEHGSLELDFASPYLMNTPTTLTSVTRIGTTERRIVFRDIAEAFERQLVAFHRFATQDEPPLTGRDGALSDIVTAQRIVRRLAESAGLPIGGEAATPEASPDVGAPPAASPETSPTTT
ncbi:Gfo/Idh/MocA family protein [Microtetraspora malaysiensis]|uniref:Gfo/Idh/MocA family protein n=1 Tax=Microtetraspora malaysiensis TaxID=161358 RepID=UPI003D8AB088